MSGDRDVAVEITVDVSRFVAAMRHAARASRSLTKALGPAPWSPRSWYARSERAS